ncbi:GAF and ANTAR domain-containing protein [Spirillospora sp. NPDC127200]
MHIDPEALDASLRALRHAPREPDLERALGTVVQAVQRIFGCDGAGLMFTDPSGALRYVTATDELGRGLEVVQAELGEGPCVEAYLRARVISCDDLTGDRRWPVLARRLNGAARVRGVLAAPVRLAGTPVGCLNLYATEPRPWDGADRLAPDRHDSDRHALAAYAELIEQTIAAALAAEHTGALARQLEHALHSRVMIERAIGFLMADRGVDAREAFDRLRREARSSRRRVAHVAAELLGEPVPDDA